MRMGHVYRVNTFQLMSVYYTITNYRRAVGELVIGKYTDRNVYRYLLLTREPNR